MAILCQLRSRFVQNDFESYHIASFEFNNLQFERKTGRRKNCKVAKIMLDYAPSDGLIIEWNAKN